MIVGRDEEIAALDALFRDAAAGQPAAAVIRGPVGSGKTALLRLFTERAGSGGALCLGAVGARAESGISLGILHQLFGDKRLPAELARRAGGLLRTGAVAREEQGSPAAAGAFDDLVALLAEAAEVRPVVLAVDDIQHADLASMRWLSFLLRRTRTAPVLAVLTECTHSPPADRQLHAELLRQGSCHCICLGPLPQPAVTGLLGQYLPAAAAQRLGPACLAITGGNPLLVQALGQDSRGPGGAPPADLEPRTAFRAAVADCLYRHEPETVCLAQALAVLAKDATPSLVGELLDSTAEAVSRGLAALTGSGLLDSVRFRHEAVRDAVLDRMALDERAVLHGRAAWTLYRNGAAPAILARHLAAAGRGPAHWAVPVLREAADKALAAGQVDVAIDYLTRAESDCRDERQLVAIRFALARARWCTDPEHAGRHLPGLVADAGAGRLNSEHLAELASYLLWLGDDGEAARVLAVADVPPGGSGPAEETFPYQRVTLLSRLDGLCPGLMRPRGGEQAGPELAESDAELILHERLNDPAHVSVITALLTLISDDRLDRAASWCHVLRQGADGSASAFREAVLEAARAMIEIRRGSLDTATGHARAALAALTPKAWGVGIGWPISSLLLAATSRDQEEAAQLLRIPVPEAMFETRYGLLYLYARADYYLCTGRPRPALADLAECGRRMIAWKLDHPGLVPWRARAAEAYLALGDTARARELARQQLELADAGSPRSRALALRALALGGDLGSRIALLRESAELLREADARLELAYTLSELGSVYRALGEYGRAHASARQARALADRCGVYLLRSAGAASVPGRRDQEPADPPLAGPGHIRELSAAEQRVATLAAHGYTNAEIAQELFITVSTVEQHLTRVYRKLGISGRVDLVAKVNSGGCRSTQADAAAAIPWPC